MYKIQATHRKGRYSAPPMLVQAENPAAAAKHSRLSSFPEVWNVIVSKLK